MADHMAAARVDGKSATAQLGNSETTRIKHYRRSLEDPLREVVASRSILDTDAPPERPIGDGERRTLRRTLRRRVR